LPPSTAAPATGPPIPRACASASAGGPTGHCRGTTRSE
jgi:hypothetical protein